LSLWQNLVKEDFISDVDQERGIELSDHQK